MTQTQSHQEHRLFDHLRTFTKVTWTLHSVTVFGSDTVGVEGLKLPCVDFGGDQLTGAWVVHRSTGGPLVLMRIIPLDAGQMRNSVVTTHHKYEAEHDANSKVDPLVCHGCYHFPGILTGVVPLHAVRDRYNSNRLSVNS